MGGLYSTGLDGHTSQDCMRYRPSRLILCSSEQIPISGTWKAQNSQYHSGLCAPGAKSMRNARFGWVVFCALVATSGCRRVPSPDWNGTWKVNPSKSNYQGAVLTISVSADNEYRFDESSSHTIRCDGKYQPMGNNRALTCTKRGVAALDITLKENGVKTRATRDELSSDGKVFTTTMTVFPPNGPVFTSQIIFSRLSGSNGFAGQWRDTSYLQQHADMTLRLDNQALHIDYPSEGQQIDATLDGAGAPVRGPQAPEGTTTLSVRPDGSREFLVTTKRNGKVFSQGSLKLSNDGRAITNTWWNPDRPNVKGTLVYEKK